MLLSILKLCRLLQAAVAVIAVVNAESQDDGELFYGLSPEAAAIAQARDPGEVFSRLIPTEVVIHVLTYEPQRARGMYFGGLLGLLEGPTRISLPGGPYMLQFMEMKHGTFHMFCVLEYEENDYNKDDYSRFTPLFSYHTYSFIRPRLDWPVVGAVCGYFWHMTEFVVPGYSEFFP